jgi:hypothetical protein
MTDTYAGDSRILPDTGVANFQQHTIKTCNHPTDSEIIERSQTAGIPCAIVELLTRTDTYQQNSNAKTVFNTSGCIQITGSHECLA